jgi:hypothetical protein
MIPVFKNNENRPAAAAVISQTLIPYHFEAPLSIGQGVFLIKLSQKQVAVKRQNEYNRYCFVFHYMQNHLFYSG